jgi:hypothetical protein
MTNTVQRRIGESPERINENLTWEGRPPSGFMQV